MKINPFIFALFLLTCTSITGIRAQEKALYFSRAVWEGHDSVWEPYRTEKFRNAVPIAQIRGLISGFKSAYGKLTPDSVEVLFQGTPAGFNVFFFDSTRKPVLVFSIFLEHDSISGLLVRPLAGHYSAQPPEWARQLPKPEIQQIRFRDGYFPAFYFPPINSSEDFPLVYLMNGSGPNNAWTSVGPNAPMLELAWRLQYNGIGVIMHAKITYLWPGFMSQPEEQTIENEYIEPAKAVAHHLLTHFESHPLFISGHSMGGMMLPAVAELFHQCSGLIFIAANSTPLYSIIPNQLEYLSKNSGTWNIPEARKQIQDLRAAMTHFHQTGELKQNPIPGTAENYWQSVRNYSQVKTWHQLNYPSLFIFGQNDYQVPPSEAKGWVLKQNRKSQLYIAPDVDHLLRRMREKSTPQSYQTYFPVDISIADRMASFIKANASQ